MNAASAACLVVVLLAMPSSGKQEQTECGTEQHTVEDRQRDCAAQPGSAKIPNNGVTWNLITRKREGASTVEVWRDSSTGVLWGDRLEGYFTHAGAVTLAQAGDGVRVAKEVACASDAGVLAGGRIAEVKFGLPTANEFDQARADGLKDVLPHLVRDDPEHYRDRFWTVSLKPEATPELRYALQSPKALAYDSRDFGMSDFLPRETLFSVRCVARPPPSSMSQPVSAPLAGRVECGTTQEKIVDRMKDCARFTRSHTPGWNLVTRRLAAETGQFSEVWRDAKTGLLWGDRLQGTYDHYQAVKIGKDGKVVQELACESPAGQRANGMLPGIAFRVPSKSDFQTGRANGMTLPLRDQWFSQFWSNEVWSDFVSAYVGGDGGGDVRTQLHPVRCVSSAPVDAPELTPTPMPECGGAGAIADRIKGCAAAPGSTWESESHVLWKLATRKIVAGRNVETWRDERTGLLWGDLLDKAYPYRKAEKACRGAPAVGSAHFQVPTMAQLEEGARDGLLDAAPNVRGGTYWAGSSDACAGENVIVRNLPHLPGTNADEGRGWASIFHAAGDGAAVAPCDQSAAVHCVGTP